MGELVILHPQPCVKHPCDNMFYPPVKSHRTVKFNHSRRQTPPPRKRNTTACEPPATAASKNLVMGQVKILKRGESLGEPSMISKNLNSCRVSSSRRSTQQNDQVADREVYSGVLATKKTTVSSMRRTKPESEIVSKPMKNLTECYAGFGFVDSPPPSLVPLPTFSVKKTIDLIH